MASADEKKLTVPVGMIHPNYFNTALRSLGVPAVTVVEDENGMRGVADDMAEAVSQLVNAVTLAYTKLIAAESCIGTLERTRMRIHGLRTGQASEAEVEDMLGDLKSVIRSLTNITHAD